MEKKAKVTTDEPEEDHIPLKLNECIERAGTVCEREHLFDEFWREGELGLLFGPPGVGKSLLAVQIADAAGRGRGIEGFRMPMYRRRVLYVDLVLSRDQFINRYSYPRKSGERKCYRFSDSIYRARPKRVENLVNWLRSMIEKGNYQTVIIDDLSAVRQTFDGTRETLKMMRGLKAIKDETGTSILVLTGTARPRRNGLVSEADLGRSRVLADTADTVFAMGYHPRVPGQRYLIQARSRTSTPVWNEHNAPICQVARTDGGLLALAFDARFAERISNETRRMICRIKAMRDRGSKLREIADELGISVSKASRLYRKWSPALSAEDEAETAETERRREKQVQIERSKEIELEEWEEGEYEKPLWLDYEKQAGGQPAADGAETIQPAEPQEPAEARTKRRSIYDLEKRLDGSGKEVFVESELVPGKPKVWYRVDSEGYIHKWVRKCYGSTGMRLGPAPFLDP